MHEAWVTRVPIEIVQQPDNSAVHVARLGFEEFPHSYLTPPTPDMKILRTRVTDTSSKLTVEPARGSTKSGSNAHHLPIKNPSKTTVTDSTLPRTIDVSEPPGSL
jgi:hypothetical protein